MTYADDLRAAFNYGWDRATPQGDRDREATAYIESLCNGICLTGGDLGVPSDSIAVAHPDCPVHGHLATHEVDVTPRLGHQHEPWQIRDGANGPYCAACGERVSTYPCCEHCREHAGDLVHKNGARDQHVVSCTLCDEQRI